MKRKLWIIPGSVLAILILCFILLVPAAPLWVRMGVSPKCIQGSWPDLKIVDCPQAGAVLPAVTPLPLPTLSGQTRIPIIVDDDGSPDGLIALLYFLRNPLFDVRAVTVSSGEAHPDLFAPHLLQLLAGLGRADIPVGAGRSTPLEGNNLFPDPWRQASDVFWEFKLPQAAVSLKPVPAGQLIVDTILSSAEPVLVFVSGTHTNLAEALRIDSGIVKNIRDVYIMGGSINVPGNIKSDWPSIDNSVAEWNIWVDPIAASEVFASGLPLHLVPLDATKQVIWRKADLSGWTSSGALESARAGDLLRWMLDSWSPEGVYIWDLVAAVQATNPQVCPEESLALEVITTLGVEQGRTLAVDKSPNAAVCLEPDVDQVKALAAFIFGQP